MKKSNFVLVLTNHVCTDGKLRKRSKRSHKFVTFNPYVKMRKKRFINTHN